MLKCQFSFVEAQQLRFFAAEPQTELEVQEFSPPPSSAAAVGADISSSPQRDGSCR